ncbi:MAG: hypothetical protein IJT18_07490 [Oscillospiraceae bacterium]|nr:hypothetical protein [Oscillospiraceae bacterium]
MQIFLIFRKKFRNAHKTAHQTRKNGALAVKNHSAAPSPIPGNRNRRNAPCPIYSAASRKLAVSVSPNSASSGTVSGGQTRRAPRSTS